MAFHVNWKRIAQDQVTEIWIEAKDRKQVARAVDIVDDALRSDPESFGESRGGNQRVTFVQPLVVMFSVLPDDLRVDVLAVKRVDRPNS